MYYVCMTTWYRLTSFRAGDSMECSEVDVVATVSSLATASGIEGDALQMQLNGGYVLRDMLAVGYPTDDILQYLGLALTVIDAPVDPEEPLPPE